MFYGTGIPACVIVANKNKPEALAGSELNRYLNAEKRGLFAVVENLWDKYAVSSHELEAERAQTLKELDGFLKRLGYMEAKTS